MKQHLFLLAIFFGFWPQANAQTLHSPTRRLSMSFALTPNGEPSYSLRLGKREVLKPSTLGVELQNQASFNRGFTLVGIDSSSINETWQPVWGEQKEIKNQCNEWRVKLQQPSNNNRQLVLVFRLFDDGLGFRYEFPEQERLQYFTITDERTTFNLTSDHKAFWIPGDYDTNEYPYSQSLLSEVDTKNAKSAQEINTKSLIAANAVQTPLLLKTSDGLYINIHEAALVNYPAMNLVVDQQTFSLSSHLVPDAVGVKAHLQAPFKTPWRTIIVSDKAADILASKLILNLNEPSKIKETSWIKPQKFVGVWWEMHVDKSSWNYADIRNVQLNKTDWAKVKPNGRHGATTQRTKQYIDFAAKNGIDGVLVEGWNVGWEDWYGNWKEEVFDFVTPYPDFNVKELQQYAAAKKVKLIMHHETSGSVANYDRRLDSAYRFMKKHGYDAVKTGYVGRIIPRGEHHDGQTMVNHYNRVAEKAGENRIMIDAHEPVRPTGLHRTYPNWLTCEAARGNEFNAWSSGNPPEHETILPFTRLVGGPMDYTPGIFQIKLDYYKSGKKEQVHTTLAKQLALYVTMYSPMQMAADLPETYERMNDAFQFIKDVAVDWDETQILEAEPGDYITIARKAKNKNEWYVGAITDEQSRQTTLNLSFLEAKRKFVATLYTDAPDAHWEKNPMAYQIKSFVVDSQTKLKLALAAGGGAAISIKVATPDDLKKIQAYK
jgi:hypothetical protein